MKHKIIAIFMIAALAYSSFIVTAFTIFLLIRLLESQTIGGANFILSVILETLLIICSVFSWFFTIFFAKELYNN